MPRALSPVRGVFALAAFGLGLAGCGRSAPPEAPAGERQASGPSESIQPPLRRSPPPPAAPPPDVPAVLAAPRALTLSLERRSAGGGRSRRETIARSAERVHIERADDAVEWLFIRNPVDPRRVAARWVDHRQRVIVDYDESELRMTGIARGWADVAALGARFDALAGLEPTGRRRHRSGIAFVELAPKGGGAQRLWWSEEAALALPSDPSEPVELLELETGVDRERFIDPRRRFPSYAAFDVADYRERRHDRGAGRDAPPHHAHQ